MPSAATIAAQDEFLASSARYHKAKDEGKPAADLAVYNAVAAMDRARLEMCEAADKLTEATQRHGDALRARERLNAS